ncbi:ABC transporter ATP-binding protein [Telmatospirillum siberiense]|uniref:Nickel import system ATP-binding protein NikD n=1 Tax=Telmatospirillum siberiense TaxID=382514 RepID=A0A2N3PMR4_9PROT|nr:ABC transporter ATP-binding protein [Telmatospirillum siberiense]PKU21692.1 ABC transporter ATP-binding protein [Telmatospirillum siberiense]
MTLLEIEKLDVRFHTRRGTAWAVRGVSLSVNEGEAVGLIGESGSGKSVTAQAVMGLVHSPGRIHGGEIRWNGDDLLAAPSVRDHLRGHELAMIFQDPMTSLNPLLPVGVQLAEGMRRHLGYDRGKARARSLELMTLVGINEPERRLKQYPYEFSGGMRQRVMIAMALACSPRLLIADEPTTALDVTIQAQVLDLLEDLKKRLNLSILLISHDLGVVAGLCGRMAVMYAGQIVEEGPTDLLFGRPAHPYTAGLLRATPSIDGGQDRLLSIEGAPPDLLEPPPGCAFAARCPLADDRCRREAPPMQKDDDRRMACWRPFEPAWEMVP